MPIKVWKATSRSEKAKTSIPGKNYHLDKLRSLRTIDPENEKHEIIKENKTDINKKYHEYLGLSKKCKKAKTSNKIQRTSRWSPIWETKKNEHEPSNIIQL